MPIAIRAPKIRRPDSMVARHIQTTPICDGYSLSFVISRLFGPSSRGVNYTDVKAESAERLLNPMVGGLLFTLQSMTCWFILLLQNVEKIHTITGFFSFRVGVTSERISESNSGLGPVHPKRVSPYIRCLA